VIDTSSGPSNDRTRHDTNVIAQLLSLGNQRNDPPPPHRTASRCSAGLAHHPHIQHANLAITSVYLRGIDNTEIIHTIHERPRR
jgi:hypothetical protein